MRRAFLIVLAVGLSLVGCKGIAQRLAKKNKPSAAVDAAATLTQSYPSPSGLITSHYPPDFAAKITGKAAIMMSRNIEDGESELITLVAVGEPVSPDWKEFSRTVSLAETKKLDNYHEVSRTPTKCMGVDGLEIYSTWKPGTTSYHRWWCAFVRNGHGYAFAYTLPVNVVAQDEALLKAIVNATTFDQ
jgi:hypothetical protein